ncbi:phosphoglycerate dehydrogenase [Atractiella rhizophila]|nr:phosphoglycerate dehydrogenase [Atractiella rhizophila]
MDEIPISTPQALPNLPDPLVVLEPEGMYEGTALEEELFSAAGARVKFIRGNIGRTGSLDDIDDEICKTVHGILIFRHHFGKDQIARFPLLRACIRCGAGYDILDREELARRNVLVANIPDYGTAEVADHAIALALSLRRGVSLHEHLQRANPPAPWEINPSPLIHRLEGKTFGVLGLGRIGTAAALRAKAFGWKVIFYDPYLKNGVDKSLGFERIKTLEEFFRRTDTLSIHAPLTHNTRGLVTERLLRLMPAKTSVLITTARGPIVDLDGLEAVLKDNHLAGAALDVLPKEAHEDHSLVQAYRNKEPWTLGRLIITPHSAFWTPEAWQDIRRLTAETIVELLVYGSSLNVIRPEQE